MWEGPAVRLALWKWATKEVNMRKIIGARAFILVCLVCASPAMATDFKLYGSYWNTSDVDDTFGGGLGFGFPLGGSPLSIAIGGTYYRELSDEPLRNLFEDDDQGFFQEDSLEVLPIDVSLQYRFPTDGTFHPWIGGGASYFLIDTTRSGVDVDDETGWHASAGAQIGDRSGVNFFAEAVYRSTEATLERRSNDNVDLVDRVKIDLDGFAVNAGLLWSF
jgi:hypothetical protein